MDFVTTSVIIGKLNKSRSDEPDVRDDSGVFCILSSSHSPEHLAIKPRLNHTFSTADDSTLHKGMAPVCHLGNAKLVVNRVTANTIRRRNK